MGLPFAILIGHSSELFELCKWSFANFYFLESSCTSLLWCLTSIGRIFAVNIFWSSLTFDNLPFIISNLLRQTWYLDWIQFLTRIVFWNTVFQKIRIPAIISGHESYKITSRHLELKQPNRKVKFISCINEFSVHAWESDPPRSK